MSATPGKTGTLMAGLGMVLDICPDDREKRRL
jgi:hypothetical protein